MPPVCQTVASVHVPASILERSRSRVNVQQRLRQLPQGVLQRNKTGVRSSVTSSMYSRLLISS
jgi:hypothetical protein